MFLFKAFLLLFNLNVVVKSSEVPANTHSSEPTLWDTCKLQFESNSHVESSCLAKLDCLSLGSAELAQDCYSKKLEYLNIYKESEDIDPTPDYESPNHFLLERDEYKATLNVSNQGELNEWTPVAASIYHQDIQKYEFPINYTSPGISASYEIIVFFSASICSMPSDWDYTSPDNGLSVYYTLNETLFENSDIENMESSSFEYGFAQGYAKVQVSDTYPSLYIIVKSDECDECNSNYMWTYELGVSQNSLVFQYEIDQLLSPIDTDYNSVLLSSISSSYENNSSSSFMLYVFPETTTFNHTYLNNSWCAVHNSESYITKQDLSTENITTSTFQLSGFDESTTYKAILLEEFTTVAYGGIIYKAFDFTTKSSTACKIISNLEFCSNVAYAVPNTDHMNETELALAYDNQARSLYQNFDYALQQVACDTEADASFSPIRTCNDCAESYKNWLCSVTIPRCATSNETGYKAYNALGGRNSFIENEIRPNLDYYEILPCVNMCHAIVRDCPSDFGFACPSKNSSIKLSYYWDEGQEYTSCNYVGVSSVTNAALRSFGVNGIYWVIWVIFGVVFSLV